MVSASAADATVGRIANGAEVKLLGSWSDIVRSWKASL
jgi:hypothetical protein